MPEYRARATDICMSDPMPFQQAWVYRTTWPLAEILNDKFFLPLRDQLRAGDTIRMCRYDRADATHREAALLETCQVIVIQSSREAQAVPVKAISELILLADAQEPDGEFSVEHRGRGTYAVMKGDQVYAGPYGSKPEAEAMFSKLMAA